ncbi:hypothetical protein HGRIS_002075 [Hohenbuehelia grisea]|uniref:Uncharacterized protein n=1 Tax=Hohenbuehelia grisea TaxID=104357 RepID=A0ABR3JJG2_9AGAR
MLTVLGVVIGFVISYRASSGYDRYWMGRTCWSDVIRNARSISRLVWFHVPPRLTPKTQEETDAGKANRSAKEMNKVMAEKRMALDLVEGFAVALKHHIRGELGIYYEDLYHLIRPLHDHHHNTHLDVGRSTAIQSPRKAQRIASSPPMPQPRVSPAHSPSPDADAPDPIVPAINAYGTFTPPVATPSRTPASTLHHHHHHAKRRRSTSASSRSSTSSSASSVSAHRPLLPSTMPDGDDGIVSKVSGDLIPFASFYHAIRRYYTGQRLPLEVLPPDIQNLGENADEEDGGVQRKWGGPVYSTRQVHWANKAHGKHRPRVAGGGENLPLEILRCLSEWCSVLEDRGTVPGTTMGAMIAYISNFEESMAALEKILTTPLPFTVWLYLFFLPFQLVGQFGWYTIPGVGIAAFIYLGFLAAGEEIEQPFGYDENDLDLDLFCAEVIHADIAHLKSSPCLNAYFPGPHRPTYPVHRRSLTLVEATELVGTEEDEGEEIPGLAA